MEKSLLLRKFIFFFILACLIFPLFFLGLHFPLQKFYWDPFLISVFKGAFLQTVLSLFFTLGLGFFGALSLFSLKEKFSSVQFQVLCFLLISPSFIPPIIVVLLMAKALLFLPTGLSGVVFYHSIMNVGLVSVLLFRQIEKKAQGFARDSLIAGISKTKFIFNGLLPEMKSDLLLMSFYFFVLFFFSFSVPFLVGGSVYGGFEVFIYEKILFFGQWGEAIQYAFYLFFLLFLISRFFDQEDRGKGFWNLQVESPFPSTYSPLSLAIVPLVPVLVLLAGFVMLFVNLSGPLDWSSLGHLVRGTWLVSLLTGFFVFILLSGLSFAYVQLPTSRLLLSLVYPGWVIVGFAFLLLPGESPLARLLKIALSLSFLYLPFVYRLSFHQTLKDLIVQVNISRTFPTHWNQVFARVIFPQVLPSIAFLSGLCALWAVGDFAMTGMLIDSQQTSTLAYEIKELMGHYRLEQALMYMPSLLFSSLLIFLLFPGIAYVSRSKNLS